VLKCLIVFYSFEIFYFLFLFLFFFLESLSEEGKGEYRRGGNGPMGVYGWMIFVREVQYESTGISFFFPFP
jgi:hypothetical protein